MYCRKCGNELQDEWKVCPNCGEPVNDVGQNSESFSNKTGEPGLPKKRKLYRRWPFWIIILVICAIVAFLLLNMLGQNKDISNDQVVQEKTEKTVEKEVEPVTDFSDQDFSTFLGKTETDLENSGLIENEDTGEYSAMDGNLLVKIKDGQVNEIVITGDEKIAPVFDTVALGTTGDEAKAKLAEDYPETQDITDGFKLLNLNTKGSVECTLADNKVTKIRYIQLSDEEIEAFKTAKEEKLRAEYIFPDSDKKYLSEDEIRTKTVDEMLIGRNEIFARHGYIFTDENLKNHFESTSWYEGTIPTEQFNSDQVFNDFEKKNVELIKKVEDEINRAVEEDSRQEVFIGMNGSYQCGSDESSGVIDVYVQDRDIYIAIGTHEFPGIIGGVGGGLQGIIQDSQTANFEYGDCVFTLTWSDIGMFTVTRTGSSGLAEVDTITDNVDYVNAEYYHVS